MKKSIIGFVFLLVILPLIIPITGCDFEIFGLVCDVACTDDCDITYDLYCAGTDCEMFCDIELKIVNLPPGVCNASSAIVLEKKSPVNDFYVNEADNNGDLIYHEHNQSGSRIVTLEDCIDIDQTDPQKTIKEIRDNLKNTTVAIKMCVDDGSCTEPPYSGANKTLYYLPFSSGDIIDNIKWDEASCRVKINVDANELQPAISCVDCCTILR